MLFNVAIVTTRVILLRSYIYAFPPDRRSYRHIITQLQMFVFLCPWFFILRSYIIILYFNSFCCRSSACVNTMILKKINVSYNFYFSLFILYNIIIYTSRHNNIIHTHARKSDDLARRGAINGIPPPPQPLAIIITFLVNSASSPQTAMAARCSGGGTSQILLTDYYYYVYSGSSPPIWHYFSSKTLYFYRERSSNRHRVENFSSYK